MSTALQECRSLRASIELLWDLCGEHDVPQWIQERARVAERHFPLAADVQWAQFQAQSGRYIHDSELEEMRSEYGVEA